MRYLKPCVVLLSCLTFLGACQQQQDNPSVATIKASPVVASVNGVEIYASDIDAELARLPASMLQYRQDPKARQHILNSLIRRLAVSQKAKTLGLDLNPMVKQRMQAAQAQILIEAAKSWQLAQMQPIQAAEIERYYHEHKREFMVPAQAHARHILVKTEKQAWQILKQLRRKRSQFAQLAASKSIDVSNNSRGGNLNWFSRGTMVKALEDVVFSLKKHGLSKPLKTQFGWHVIELLGKRPPMQKSLADVRTEIISSLQHQRLERWYQEVVQSAEVIIKQVNDG
ncbi:MAG: peptidylprolyl isomerase [Mariprofundus sp.]|nr:peptidylprolyl isomerase [Mariprofundus sp.]